MHTLEKIITHEEVVVEKVNSYWTTQETYIHTYIYICYNLKGSKKLAEIKISRNTLKDSPVFAYREMGTQVKNQDNKLYAFNLLTIKHSLKQKFSGTFKWQ